MIATIFAVTIPAGADDVTPPEVTVTISPADPIFGDLVTITATATDDVGVTEISIYVDDMTTPVATSSSSSCSTTPQTYSLGTHTYLATASDGAGNIGTSMPKPELTIIQSYWDEIPVGSKWTFGTHKIVNLEGNTNYGSTGILSDQGHWVLIEVDSQLFYFWDPSESHYNANIYQLVSWELPSFTIVDANPPVVTVTVNPTNPTQGDLVTITATATDDVGVTEINIYVDDETTPVKTGSSSPCSTTPQTYSLGTHTYYATASDGVGNIGTTRPQPEHTIVQSLWPEVPVGSKWTFGIHKIVNLYVNYNYGLTGIMSDQGHWVIREVDTESFYFMHESWVENPYNVNLYQLVSWELASFYVIPNQPPVADAGGPYSVDEGSEITFDASGSFDPDGDELQYRWDIDNDGIYETDYSMEPSSTHTWYDDYSSTIVVQVYDGLSTATDETTVTVNNVAPTAYIDDVKQPFSDYILPLDVLEFHGSLSDPGLFDVHTIEWNFGDGTVISKVSLIEPHVYTSPGEYTVTLIVTEYDGASGSATKTIIVKTPEEATDNVITEIVDMNFADGIENSLVSKLENAIKSIANDRPSAYGQLGALINEVEAQRGNELTDEEADEIIVMVQRIMDNLGG
jgi:hypothetical protein